MLRRLYDWTLRLAGHPRAELALGGVTFAESSFFPIPPDALLVPMVLANRAKAWRYAAICAISSVLGGIAGYFIGLLLFESVAMPILAFYGLLENFEQVAERYNELGWLMVLLGGGFTPLPYKVITITSGVTQLDLWLFVGLSLVARSLRVAATCAETDLVQVAGVAGAVLYAQSRSRPPRPAERISPTGRRISLAGSTGSRHA